MKGIRLLLVLLTVFITAGCSDTYEKVDTDADVRKMILNATEDYVYDYEHNSQDSLDTSSSLAAKFINDCLDAYSGDDISDYKLLVTYIEMNDIEHVKELQQKLGDDIIE